MTGVVDPQAEADARARHAEVRSAFLRCRGLSGEEREAALEGLDGRLRREVEELLEVETADDALSDRRIDGRTPLAPWIAAAAEEPLPERIAGFRVLRRLGAGGMGVVYEAEQEKPRRRVAVKLVRPGLAFGERLRRFHLEAEALGRLKHPGIAQIFEVGTCDLGSGEQPYFVMELVEGQPLLVHARERKLERRARLALVAELCDAVQHAHERGVVHRDLKPDNVLVDGEGRAKVLDFGVARVRADDVPLTTIHTAQGQIVGTLTHMAPEQLAGNSEAVGPAADVYALGVIAFELLTGRLPHEVAGLSLTAAVRQITETEAPRLGTLQRSLRGDVETIVAKALDPDPTRRYVSPAALASDLHRYLAHEPIAARPPSRSYRLARFARRNPWLVGTLVALSLGLLGTLGFALVARTARVRESAANDGLRDALYIAETRTASLSAQEPSGFGALDAYVTRWGEILELEPWEFRHFRRQAREPHAAVDCGPEGFFCATPSPTGEWIATSGNAGICVRDAERGNVLFQLRRSEFSPGFPAFDPAWSPDGTLLAAALADDQPLCDVLVWDVERREVVRTFPSQGDGFGAIEWGRELLYAGTFGGQLLGYDVDTGEEIWKRERIAGPRDALKLSPDGSLLACGSASGTAVFEASREAPLVRTLPCGARSVAWSADGALLAIGDVELVRVFDVETGTEVERFRAHDKAIVAMQWHPTEDLLATASWDFSSAIWDTRSWHEVRRLCADSERILSVDWSKDGTTLITGAESLMLRLWSLEGPAARRRGWFEGGSGRCELSCHPDGSRLLAVGGGLQLLRLDAQLPRGGGGMRAAMTAHWNAPGDRIAVLHHERLQVLDEAAEAELGSYSLDDPGNYFNAMSWHARDSRLALFANAGVIVLDTDRMEETLTTDQPLGSAECGEWAPDGESIYVALTTGLREMDAATGATRKERENARTAYSMDLSPDGSSLALGLREHDVLIVDTETFEITARLRGHANEVWAVAWHPAEPRLASAGPDGKIILWDTDHGRLVAFLDPEGPMGGLQWSRDGEQLISLTRTGLISVWDARALPE